MFTFFWTPKTSINKSRSHSQINKHPVTGNFVSILLLPWSSRVVRGDKMASQGASGPPKWPPKVLPRCQNGLSRCSRDAKMESQNAKKKAPRSPNYIWGEKKHDMLKWMLGCSRGVDMVFRNTEIEDSSKIKRGTKAPKGNPTKQKGAGARGRSP